MYRQGDVLLIPLEADEDLGVGFTLQANDDGQIVVMEGEATGHAHVLPADRVKAYRDGHGVMLLDVAEEAPLTHEEHNPIPVPPGKYRVVRQREYSPETRRMTSNWSYVSD